MKRFVGIGIVALFVAPFAAAALAADTVKTNGTISAVAADSVTIKTDDNQEMTFAIDDKTKIIARGASTMIKKAKKEGKAVPVTDILKVDDKVQVKYHDMGETKHAAEVRKVSGKM
ncbi:MAG: hypothetical protein HYX76_10055 [Acidobacteria bacterium]|nr:hypothetical protein [Acidobacteriota bacterium]